VPFAEFDRQELWLRPLRERVHDLSIETVLPSDGAGAPELDAEAQVTIEAIAEDVVAAQARGAAVIVFLGGHVIRAGVARVLNDLIRRGLVNHVAGNGAVAIHDFEFALVGATTESVARYISEGQFGLWEETGWINEAAVAARRDGIGWGEAIGRMILDGRGEKGGDRTAFPHAEVSVAAACAAGGVPFTIHPGVGYDIIHEHPNCDGAAMGEASYRDFLILARSIQRLEGGVVINAGSAVMGPEVYLKALAMARNVAKQRGERVSNFTVAVFDLVPLDADTRIEPAKSDPLYYFRPWKTMLVRTVADGGSSHYVCGDHRATFPALRRALIRRAWAENRP
jgi:hypothetical protein